MRNLCIKEHNNTLLIRHTHPSSPLKTLINGRLIFLGYELGQVWWGIWNYILEIRIEV